MHILLVEDNHTIATNIKKFLQLENHKIDIASTGDQGLKLFEKKFYDFILLDVMLPGPNGFQICKKIRETREVPILMLTAKSQLEDKKEGFSCGADDYLVKPFDLEELLLRIQAISKRFEEPTKRSYKNIDIFSEQKKILKTGQEIKLTIKERTILEYLLQNENIAIARTEIIEHVRGGDSLFEWDDKLDVYISNLRKKLDKSLIHTIKGFGYKISKQ